MTNPSCSHSRPCVSSRVPCCLLLPTSYVLPPTPVPCTLRVSSSLLPPTSPRTASYLSTYARMRIRMHACCLLPLHARTHTYIHIRMHVCTCACVCMCVHVCAHAHAGYRVQGAHAGRRVCRVAYGRNLTYVLTYLLTYLRRAPRVSSSVRTEPPGASSCSR